MLFVVKQLLSDEWLNLCSICVQSVFNLCSICVQSVFNLCSTCVQSVFNLCSICVQSVFNLCSICVQSVFNLCSICVQSVFNLCSTCVQSVHKNQLKYYISELFVILNLLLIDYLTFQPYLENIAYLQDELIWLQGERRVISQMRKNRRLP